MAEIICKSYFYYQKQQGIAAVDVISDLLYGHSWMLTCTHSEVSVAYHWLFVKENAFVTGKDNRFKQRLYNIMELF